MGLLKTNYVVTVGVWNGPEGSYDSLWDSARGTWRGYRNSEPDIAETLNRLSPPRREGMTEDELKAFVKALEGLGVYHLPEDAENGFRHDDDVGDLPETVYAVTRRKWRFHFPPMLTGEQLDDLLGRGTGTERRERPSMIKGLPEGYTAEEDDHLLLIYDRERGEEDPVAVFNSLAANPEEIAVHLKNIAEK